MTLKELLPLNELKGKSVAACGSQSKVSLYPGAVCGRIVDLRIYPDHHPYSSQDVSELAAWAKSLNADLILTTQKDFVKLRTSAIGMIPLRALRIGLEIMEGRSILDEALQPLLPPRAKNDLG